MIIDQRLARTFLRYFQREGVGVDFLSDIEKEEEYLFYKYENDNENFVFSTTTVEQRNRIIFGIIKSKFDDPTDGYTTYDHYYSFEDTDVSPRIVDGDQYYENGSVVVSQEVRFGFEEKSFFRDLYSGSAPSFQLSFENFLEPSLDRPQASVENENLSYNSLSSMDEIGDETITVTATTGSVTGLVTETADTPTDVGNISSRNRQIQSTGVTVGGPSTRTVTTRGY